MCFLILYFPFPEYFSIFHLPYCIFRNGFSFSGMYFVRLKLSGTFFS
jgi:hypothetical protein